MDFLHTLLSTAMFKLKSCVCYKIHRFDVRKSMLSVDGINRVVPGTVCNVPFL